MVHFRRGDVLQLGPTDFKDASELIDDELASSALPAHWPKIKSQPNEELNTPRPVFARVLAATKLPGLAIMSASIMKTPPCSRWRLGLATYRAKGHGEHEERGINSIIGQAWHASDVDVESQGGVDLAGCDHIRRSYG
ncbi:hypothetical protein E4U38_000428 [Claviceps purpurea]|nr:hypothetical protein E4U38_000428 [Claviceps purpurea]